MAQMLLSEARTFLQDELLRAGSTGASDSRADRALQAGGNRFNQNSRIVRRSAEAAMVADVAKIVLSTDSDFDQFRPERLIRAEIGYEATGEWATATAYTKNQMVFGDGAPDTKFYRCILAHTSASGSEPGLGATWETNWQLLAWDEGFKLDTIAFDTMARRLNQNVTTGFPTEIAFQNNADTAYVHPAPDVVYTLRVYFWEPLLLKNASTGVIETWVIGDSGDGAHEINIPEEYIHDMIIRGALPVLDRPNLSSNEFATAMATFDAWAKEVGGKTGHEGWGFFDADPSAYIT